MKNINMEKIMETIGCILSWAPMVIVAICIGGWMETGRILDIVFDNPFVRIMGIYIIVFAIFQIVDYFRNRKN